MARRVIVASSAALVALALAALWWLTRRPLDYDARRAEGISGGESAWEGPPADVVAPGPAADGGGDAGDAIEAPIELPPEAPPIVRTETARVPSFRHTANYLLVGVDHTRGRWWGRADTLLVAVFDDESTPSRPRRTPVPTGAGRPGLRGP